MGGVMPSSRARSTSPVALALVLTALAALALLGPACGGDPVELESRTLRMRLDEYRLVPQDVKVRAGRLRIRATNAGRLTHNVRVVRLDPDDRESPGVELGGTETAQPGDTVNGTIDRVPAGEYRLICSIANHDDLGMYGTLEAERTRRGGE